MDSQSGIFQPRPIDVIVVKTMLSKATQMPPEVVDIIIDHAEYWPHCETVIERPPRQDIRISSGRRDRENALLLRSPPVGFDQDSIAQPGEWISTPAAPEPLREAAPVEAFKKLRAGTALERPVRKIVFTLRSRDQGWGGEAKDRGTFEGSWTWFEAGLERFEAGLERFDGNNEEEGDKEEVDATCQKSLDSKSTIDKKPPTRLQLSHPFIGGLGRSFLHGPRAARHLGSQSFAHADEGNDEGKNEGEDKGKGKGKGEGEGESETTAPFRDRPFRVTGLRPVYPETEVVGNTPRYNHPLEPNQQQKIQCNRTATSTAGDYRIVWSWTDDISPDSPEAERLKRQGRGKASGTGEFVRNLRLGDVVTVWAKSRFPGWANNVQKVGVAVYWAV
ncbi:hypothetical protein SODALDRAFT_330730 [Sodiomyces alkalinus F11]|uniref:Ankyrin repeat protein n=1 Tax=Sodiomyces alkalinus (strain CBS 110278 / VKM F-3762 / F11) TaxID=1314773 RepID=A0A3N2Q2L9_SODAK|nr:hypothetical protein SODALDRAFT_330730 [Sodiomyces alkalinus F11]ROT41011.1 hypothetical protein SODALDRAFT_330730 [Sodiomyces alkalinus F11]